MLRSLAAPLAWSLYIALPAAGWGWLDGAPLGTLEAAALALVWWTWGTTRSLPGASVLAVLAVVKIASSGVLVDRGFAANYYANDAWTAPAARSIEFRGAPYTRRDARLAFGTGGAPDLPLHYFNDVAFNFYRPDEPRRDGLPYSVEWTGYLRRDPAGAVFYVDPGPGVSAELSVDGRIVASAEGAFVTSMPIGLDAPWHAVALRATAPYGASRRIEAGTLVESTRRPFDDEQVFPETVGSLRLAADRAIRWTARAGDALVLLAVVVLAAMAAQRAWRGRRLTPLVWLVAAGEALAFARAYEGRMVVLSGGDDWLSYESLARAIALGDVLLREPGPVAGQGAPFFYQPLYPYFLALTHVGFGDALFGAVLAQRLLLVAAMAWTAGMTSRLFGSAAGSIALVGGGAFLYAKAARWTPILLAEPFFLPLFVGWTALLVAGALEPSRRRTIAAGAIGGLATLTRSTLMLAWAPMLAVWRAALRSGRGPLLATLLLTMIAVTGLATVRNWLVADRLVLMATSMSVNLSLGNPPARPLAPPPAGRAAAYARLGLDENLRRVAEFAAQAPGDFARGLGNKALYTAGFFGRSGLDGGIGTSWLYVGMWVLALAGAVRVARGRPRTPAVWLPAAGALSHSAAVVLVFPHGYTDRLIVPLYPLLIPYAAVAVESLVPILGRVRQPLGGGLAAAAAWLRRGIVAPVRGFTGERRNWAYIAYAAAVTPWLSGEMWRAALIVPVVALVTARLTRSGRVHLVAAGLLWAAALGRVALAGSRSSEALHDPLFWGLAAIVALGAAAATRRRPAAAAALAAAAGVCTMTATLLPLFPDFESAFPPLNADASLRMLELAIGPAGVMCLLAIWLQAAAAGTVRGATARLLVFATRGALAAALLFLLAGGLPGEIVDARVWFAVLAVLSGLAEGPVRAG